MPVLVTLGIGLGVFTPSNNDTTMGTAPTQSAATVGGLLNLTRGLGTALGVAAVTLAYHLGSDQHFTARGEQLAVVVLLAAALLAGLSSWLATGSLATAP